MSVTRVLRSRPFPSRNDFPTVLWKPRTLPTAGYALAVSPWGPGVWPAGRVSVTRRFLETLVQRQEVGESSLDVAGTGRVL